MTKTIQNKFLMSLTISGLCSILNLLVGTPAHAKCKHSVVNDNKYNLEQVRPPPGLIHMAMNFLLDSQGCYILSDNFGNFRTLSELLAYAPSFGGEIQLF